MGPERTSESSKLTIKRIVIWTSASLDVLGQTDREWISEQMTELDLESLQDLNGISPSTLVGDQSGGLLEAILHSADLGRLVELAKPLASFRLPTHLSQFVLSQNVDILELSTRPANCLRHAEIKTIAEIYSKSEEELLAIKNMGKNSVAEIRSKLQELLGRDPEQLPTSKPSRPESISLSILLRLDDVVTDEGILGKLRQSGITRVDDLATRNVEALRYWCCLSPSEITALQVELDRSGLFLESVLPSWVREHYAELQEAFKCDLNQVSQVEMESDSVGPTSIIGKSTPQCLEEELETFFTPTTNNRKKRITRRRLGWDGGQGATLDQVGEEFGLTRERARQIVSASLRKPIELNSDFFNKAIACVAAHIPATTEFVEQAVVDAGISRSRLRVECLVKTARHLDVVLPWGIEEWNGRRIVIDSRGTQQVQEFQAAARRRVSHYGVTNREFVLAELPAGIAEGQSDLFFSLLENPIWLDESRNWFWLPTGRNPILSRLAKILRVVPRIPLVLAQAGVLRDARMQGVTLPPDVFQALCASLPWCRVEGDEVIAGDGVPAGEDDSDEQLITRILRQSGPVMYRHQLRAIASQAGMGDVNFSQVLSNSTVIVKFAPSVYGLVGSDASGFRDQFLETDSESAPGLRPEEIIQATEEGESKAGVFDRLDPVAHDFCNQAFSRIMTRSVQLRATKAWSLLEAGLNEADSEKLRRWGKAACVDLRELAKRSVTCGTVSASGVESFALTFLTYCCEIGRNAGFEGELWPVVAAETGDALRKQVFLNDYPKSSIRDATESICSKLNIRHMFGREGEQSWLRSVFLQFGMTRSGWKRLPAWLSGGLAPVAIDLLLRPDSSVHSPSFAALWHTLQHFRWGEITETQARTALTQTPWVYRSEIDALLAAALARPDLDDPETNSKCLTGEQPDRLVGSPILTWHNEPRFELPINGRCRWLTASRYVLVLGSNKRVPLMQENGVYFPDLPGGKLTVDLSEPVITIDLCRNQVTCLPAPLAISLVPDEHDFAFYSASGRMLPLGEDTLDSQSGFLLYRNTCVVKGESPDTFTRRVFHGDWNIRDYRQGFPESLEIHREDAVLWVNQPKHARQTFESPIRPVIKCPGGRWGETVEFTVKTIDDVVPSHLLLGDQRIALDSISTGDFRGKLSLSPNIDYARTRARLECESAGRLKRILANFEMGATTGLAVESEEGWRVPKEGADLDSEYLGFHRVLARVPPRYNGTALEIEEWAWMEGDHFCGRPRNTASAIGNSLYAVGESLRLAGGPYNQPPGGQTLARSIINSGIVQWVEQDGETWQIQLRTNIELGHDHDIWIWDERHIEPVIVSRSEWIQEADTCIVAISPPVRPVAFAISFRGAWLGARTSHKGWHGFESLIESTSDWKRTASWLKWWRVPLLHERLKLATSTRVRASRLATLDAWTSVEAPTNGATYSEERDEAWRSVTRSFCWDWRPGAVEAVALLTCVGILTGIPSLDRDPTWYGYENLLDINPLLLARAASSNFSGSKLNGEGGTRISALEQLRNKLLGLTPNAGRTQIENALTASGRSAATAMGVDPNFVTQSLGRDSKLFSAGAQVNDHNLRIAIANSSAARRYLAAALIEESIRGEVK